MRIIFSLVVILFVAFCGWLVIETGVFETARTGGKPCILLQQTTVEKKPEAENTPADSELPPEMSAVTTFEAYGGPAETVKLGSIDPESGFKYQLELSTKGAAIAKATFSEFDDRDYKNPKPLVILSPVKSADGSEILPMANKDFIFVQEKLQLSLQDLHFKSIGKETAEDGSQTARFEAVIKTSAGEPVVKLLKTYKVSPNSYLTECSIVVDNLSSDEQGVRFNLAGPVGVGREDSRSDERKIVGCFRDPKGQIVSIRVGASSFDARETFAEEILGGEHQKNQEFLWAALTNRYFAAILVPLPEDSKKFCDWISGKQNQAGGKGIMIRKKRGFSYSIRRFFTGKSYEEEVEKNGKCVRFYNPDGRRSSGDENTAVGLEIDFAKLDTVGLPNSSRTYNFQLYLGPKVKSLFDKNEHYKELGFIQTIDFMSCCCPAGIINPLAFAILWIMKWMYGFIHNYGVVIIILVFLMRLILHPITKKSQVSMSKMSTLAPRAEEIRKKHANNKAEMNKQIMALYKEQGASPIMGFLPMFVQMPIWIALWSAVYASIDLRGAAFLPFWITDLSAPDAVFRFSTITIPLLGKIGELSLLPILMGVAFYLQQKLMPSQAQGSANPQVAQQQKMMMFMFPLLFPLMLYTAPSGVNLYIMASTFAGVVEQYIIRKHIREKEEAKSNGLVSVTSKTGGKVKKKKPKPFYKI